MNRRSRAVLVTGLVVSLSACGPGGAPIAEPTDSPTSIASSPAVSPTPTITVTPEPEPTATPSPSAEPPDRVVGVTAITGGGSGEVLLRWTQNSDEVDYYLVLRALTPGGSLTPIGTVTPAEVDEFEYVPFVDSNATVGYYRVRAVDASGERGPASFEVCGAAPGYSC